MLVSCGYQFSGTKPFPFKLKTINISVIENRTAYPRLGVLLANEIAHEISKNPSIRLTTKDKADAYIEGSIQSMKTEVASRIDTYTANRLETKISVNIKLFNNKGVLLWKVNNLSDTEGYDIAFEGNIINKNKTDTNKFLALKASSEILAENIYNQLINRF